MTDAIIANIPTAAMDNVYSGMRVFTRLFGLETDPLHAKYAATEFDAYQALDSVTMLVQETKRFVGKQKHVGKPFDLVDDVKQDMAEILLVDDDQVKQAVKRKRYLPLYHLVVSPTVDLLQHMDHQTAITNVEAIVDFVKEHAFIDENYGTYEDGVIAQAQVRNIIREREERSKIEAIARKKRNRKAAKKLEAEVANVTDLETEQ